MAVNPLQERIRRLEEHLQQENPVLAGCVQQPAHREAGTHALVRQGMGVVAKRHAAAD